MSGSLTSTALLLALAIAPGLGASARSESGEVVVPTRMCGQYFLIPFEVDLDGDGVPTTLTALFDTGGAGVHIDPDAVVLAGGRPIEAGKQITVRGAKAGPLTFTKLRPYTQEMDHLSRPIGTRIDLFLPMRTFKEYLLTLDFPRREMRVARGRLPKPDGVEVFDARGPDRRAYLDTTIAGRRHRLMIDSGSSGSISLHPGPHLPWIGKPIPASVSQGMTKLVQQEVGRLDADIQIAGVKIEKPLVKIGSFAELLGTEVMRRFTWTFDLRSRRVRIRPDSLEPLRLPPMRGTGAVFTPIEEGYEIGRVLPGTPAEEAGLRAGDLVIALDGTPVYGRGCQRWEEKPREKLTLSVRRDREMLDIEVAVVDLVP